MIKKVQEQSKIVYKILNCRYTILTVIKMVG